MRSVTLFCIENCDNYYKSLNNVKFKEQFLSSHFLHLLLLADNYSKQI